MPIHKPRGAQDAPNAALNGPLDHHAPPTPPASSSHGRVTNGAQYGAPGQPYTRATSSAATVPGGRDRLGTPAAGATAQPLPPPPGPDILEPGEGRVPLSTANTTTIGSAPGNTIVVTGQGVAPQHARIERDSLGRFQVTDLGSAGGTYLNGIPVQQAALMPGAELRVGDVRFLFTGTELVRYDVGQEVRVDAIDLRETTHQHGVGLLGMLGLRRKVLLDDVSITLLPGTFVAIVGASGAGKTRLLRALSGQDHLTRGRVLYNGLSLVRYRHRFNTEVGYVPQDDIVHKNLSAEQALYYAARLRLPRGTTRQQAWARVHEVLAEVELLEQSKQLIAQLSGGQRKRVNIAIELLAHPPLLYLDEPTSGLDPGLDYKMMQLLRRLADRGQTVVLVTHATNNIDMCDRICFLAPGGKLAYYGPPDALKRHFGTSDYPTIYNALDENTDGWVALFRQSPDYLRYVEGSRLQSENLARANQAPHQSQRAGQAHAAGQGSAAVADRTDAVTTATAGDAGGASVGQWHQFSLLTRRYLNLLAHDRVNLLILLLQAPIIALLVRMLTEQDVLRYVMPPPLPGIHYDFPAQRTLFIMVCSAIWFGIVNAAREIVKEEPIYRREHAINLRLLPYILSKIVVLGSLCAVQAAVLLWIVGTKSGYPARGILWQEQRGAVAELYLTLLLAALVGLAIGLMVSALAPTTDRAVSLVPIVLIPQIIFSNVIFTLNGDAGRWISYFMPSRWAMQAVGSITRLSDKFAELDGTAFYRADPGHLLGFWAALVGLLLLYFASALVFQHWKDAREA